MHLFHRKLRKSLKNEIILFSKKKFKDITFNKKSFSFFLLCFLFQYFLSKKFFFFVLITIFLLYFFEFCHIATFFFRVQTTFVLSEKSAYNGFCLIRLSSIIIRGVLQKGKESQCPSIDLPFDRKLRNWSSDSMAVLSIRSCSRSIALEPSNGATTRPTSTSPARVT